MNKWTLGLAAVGLVTLPSVMQAEEKLSAVETALSSTTISGYVDTAAQWTIGNQYQTAGPGFAFNNLGKQDGFSLNAVNVVIARDLDPKENWAAGYKIDMIYGPNAVGWNNSMFTSAGNAQNSDFGLKQAYVALRAPVGNGIDFKMGTFDSIVGYEVFNSGSNPNYTRSYGYTSEPTQHTGLLGTYQFSKAVGISAGIANTANAGINNRSFYNTPARSETDKTYMGGLTLSAPESWGFLAGSTLYGAVVSGFDTGANSFTDADGVTFGGDTRIWYYAGMTLNTPVKNLKVGFAYDYNNCNNWMQLEGLSGNWFNAASMYLSYQATEKLSIHARAEYAWTEQTESAAAPTKVYALTGTIQYDLWKNVISRIEARWDHADDGSDPYRNGNDRENFIIAANFIYKF